MIYSRNIDDLHPVVANLCNKFIAGCKREGIEVIITSTYRDSEAQDALYAIGRTVLGANPTIFRQMGQRVTNARGGQSFHNHRLAFDFVPIEFGKPSWSNVALFERCGKIGESLGLQWAGRWKSFRELPHMQWTGGLNIVQLREGQKPNKEWIA